jgi:hypothetical protein
MLAKKTYKNQLTLPKEVLKGFENVEYFDITARAGEIILRPVSVTPSAERLAQVRDRIQTLGLSEKDINDAIRWARRKA